MRGAGLGRRRRPLTAVAAFLNSLDRLNDSVRRSRELAIRDPANPIVFGNLGNSLLMAGRHEDALAAFRTALALSPDYGTAHGGAAISRALAGKDLPAALADASAEADPVSRQLSTCIMLDAMDRRAEADAALEQLIADHAEDSAYQIAQVHAVRQDRDAALQWLGRAVAQQDTFLSDVQVDRIFSGLYPEPRWHASLAKLGKTPEELTQIPFALPRSA